MSNEKVSIEELRTRREAANERREKRAQEAAEAFEYNQTIAAEKLDELEAEHGVVGVGLVSVSLPDGRIVVAKRPTQGHYRKFQDAKGGSASEHAHSFVRPHVIYPGLDAYDAILKEFPGVLAQLTQDLCALSGQRLEK